MMKKAHFVVLILLTFFSGCCTSKDVLVTTADSISEPTPALVVTAETTETEIPPEPTLVPSPILTAAEFVYDSPVREITILYTNDEHGWMEGVEEGRGAANLMGVWQDRHDYSLDGPFLVLSGGDMWQWWGEAMPSWYEGKPMVEVMNSMGYDAAALGNHEFDFGLEVLKERSSEMAFPLLSANLVYNNGHSIPEEFGISPYIILEVNGIKVGIIGLTTTTTYVKTITPAFDFANYEETLMNNVPEVNDSGVDLILVIAHVCLEHLHELANEIESLGVHMLAGGHCHELSAELVNEIVVISGGQFFENYAYVSFNVDIDENIVTVIEYGTGINQGGDADPSIESIVTNWRGIANDELDIPIGYIQNALDQSSLTLNRLLAESWMI